VSFSSNIFEKLFFSNVQSFSLFTHGASEFWDDNRLFAEIYMYEHISEKRSEGGCTREGAKL